MIVLLLSCAEEEVVFAPYQSESTPLPQVPLVNVETYEELEEPPLPSLVEKFNQSGSATDGAVMFKHCAVLNNALLNSYKDGNRGIDDTLLSIIDQWSRRTAKYVEIASIFALSVEKEEEKAAAELGIGLGIRFDNDISIFDKNYYDLLRFYTEVLQNSSLRVVEIESNQFAYVSSTGYLVRACNEVLADYCELNSISDCPVRG